VGSHIVQASAEQIGTVITNGGNLASNSTSKPIEQRAIKLNTTGPSQLIEQQLTLETASDGNTSTSVPVTQRIPDSFPLSGLGAQGDDDAIIEQRFAKRNDVDGKDSPIEQLVFGTSNIDESGGDPVLIEQQDTGSNVSTSKPIEQDGSLLNSVQVNQFDFAELIFPPCGSSKNPVNTDVLWRIRDFGFPFDTNSLIFSIDGNEVQNRPSFTLTIIAGGLQLAYDPPSDFEYNALVNIRLDIQDTAIPPNRIVYNCSWYTVPDTKAPLVNLVVPGCGAVDVSRLSPIVFDVLDPGRGVNLDSIVLSVEGVNVCEGLTYSPIITATSGSGYRGTYVHPADAFRYQSNVTVAINADDLADEPNSTFFVCDFDIEESGIPEFINIEAAPCTSFVDVMTGLKFEVYGDVDGLDISTLDVRVDNKSRKVVVQPRILRSE